MMEILENRGVIMKYYAVREGRNPGIYHTWEECSNEVIGYKGAVYKKFNSHDEALNFIKKDKTKNMKMEEDMKDNEMKSYVDGSFSTQANIYSYGVILLTNEGKETLSAYDDNMDMAQMRNVS